MYIIIPASIVSAISLNRDLFLNILFFFCLSFFQAIMGIAVTSNHDASMPRDVGTSRTMQTSFLLLVNPESALFLLPGTSIH